MTSTLRLLKGKKAGAYIYLGAVFMIVGFIATLACMHFFEMYVSRTRAQLVCDTIADGAAVAGQSHIGFSISSAEAMAEELFERNVTDSNASYDIEIVDETDSYGNPTGDKLVKVFLTSTRYPILNGGLLKRAYTVNANATVKVKVTYDQDYVLELSYWGNRYYDSVPFATTTPGNRNPAYVSWLINFYLNPEFSILYQQGGTLEANNYDNNSFFLFDYLRLMAVDLGPDGRTYHVDDPVSGSNWSSITPGLPNFGAFPGESSTTTLRHEIETNGALPYPGWTRENDIAAIQQKANEGKPAILFAMSGLRRRLHAYVVVPQNGSLPDGCVAVAYADNIGQRSNYMILKISDLENAYAFWHE